jgi:hypothetical protein
MRQSLLALLGALMLSAAPLSAHAQVADSDLAPFVGSYYGERGTAGFGVAISAKSGLNASWYFEKICSDTNFFPCNPRWTDQSNGAIVPGGQATAALWRAEDGVLIGDLLSSNDPDTTGMRPGPVRVTKLPNGGIILDIGDKTWRLEDFRPWH